MKQSHSIAALALVLMPAPAMAACEALPYILANGQVASASQVMANLNCLALKGDADFTGGVTITGVTSGYALDAGGIGRFVSPNQGSTGGVVIRDTAGDPNMNFLQFVNNSNSSQYGFIQGLKTGGLNLTGPVGVNTPTPSLAFHVNGTAGGAYAWSVISDRRLKRDIAPLPNALDTVMRLRGVEYRWRPSAEREVGKEFDLPLNARQVGFIAQEVGEVIPEAIVAAKGEGGVNSVSETKIIPFLVEAIKAQQQEIQDLRTRLGKLEGK